MSSERSFGWMAPLTEEERGSVLYAEPGEALTDGDHYLDATSPRRGQVLAMEGETVPVGGLYIRKSALTGELWQRLSAAAAGKL